MISFPDDYFDTEIRCNFRIGSFMKHNWAAQLEALKYIDEVCKKHGITYFAAFGTLLGAVRHKGFIPWDDDVDIGMKREDYMRFLTVAATELPSGYRILSKYHLPEWTGSFARVTTGGVISTKKEYLERNQGCPLSVGIDIFPYDYYPRQEKDRELQWRLLDMVKSCIVLMDKYEEAQCGQTEPEVMKLLEGQIAYHVQMTQEYTGITLKAEEDPRNQLRIIYDRLCMMYTEEECDELVSFQSQLHHPAGRWKKEWFDHTIPMAFENITMPVPIEYDRVLRGTFGDYRNPVYHGGHDYPYYKAQSDYLLEKGYWTLTDGLEAGEPLQLPVYDEKILQPDQLLLPPEWEHHIKGETGGRKKVLLIGTELTGLLRSGEGYLHKIQRVFELLKDRKEIAVWWLPFQTERCLYRLHEPELFEQYRILKERFRQEAMGICDETGDVLRAVYYSDGFYGDYGMVCDIYKQSGKPIMILDETVQ